MQEQREYLFAQLTSNPLVQYGVGIIGHDVIDEINILQATMRAMERVGDARCPEKAKHVHLYWMKKRNAISLGCVRAGSRESSC
jgi:ribonuclease HII